MIIVGVDGGGSKTSALAVDENGTVIGRGLGGPSNYHTIGLAKALGVVADATRQALNGQHADMAVYCLASCDSALDERRWMESLGALNLSRRLACHNDSFAPLRAGSSRPYGVAVICGTGFNSCAIAPDGRLAKLYSLGPLTGDWGGGYDIGEAVFGAVYRADDGRGQPTMLTTMLLKAMNVESLKALALPIVEESIPRAKIGALASLAFEAAEAGDEVARGIVLRQSNEIVTAALAMLRRLDMTDLDVDVVVSGGVMNAPGSLLLDSAAVGIAAVCPKAGLLRLAMPPVVGSVYLGFDALGVPTPEVTSVQAV